jgi:microcystin-dependent protein
VGGRGFSPPAAMAAAKRSASPCSTTTGGAQPREDTVSDPFIGEIKIWAFNWAPRGWALCDGAILQITQNQALYSLLWTQFGGDGKMTYGLPDLRGRTPIGAGVGTDVNGNSFNYQTGKMYGAETVTLTAANVPSHTHMVTANPVNGGATFPAGNNFATVVPTKSTTTQQFQVYLPNAAGAAIPNPQVLAAATVAVAGANAAHNNMQPFTVLNFCIATAGSYPPRN